MYNKPISKLYFFLKYLFIFNFYSNLMILLSFSIFIINWQLLGKDLILIVKYPIIILSIISVSYLLFKSILITSTIKKKWKFYSITIKKIERHGFKHEYFESSMFEPCMRIISWDIMRKYNHHNEYREIKKRYCKEDYNLKMEKKQLISQLKNLGADSIEFN